MSRSNVPKGFIPSPTNESSLMSLPPTIHPGFLRNVLVAKSSLMGGWWLCWREATETNYR